MLNHPAIISLIIISIISSAMLGYASYYGTKIIDKFDLKSGSETQIELEQKSYLISTILNFILILQFISFFLFIFTAEDIHSQFTGAMCAAGVLNLNGYGYPLLGIKLSAAIIAGSFIIINSIDNKAFDYPLIKTKYSMLNILSPLVMLEAIFQIIFFSTIKQDVITSCCGSLFSASAKNIGGEIASFPPQTMTYIFYAALTITSVAGVISIKTGRSRIFLYLSAISFPISIASIISFIAPYFYELPTDHCPFCILKREYIYIGYIYYLLIITAAVSTISAFVLSFNTIPPSLSKTAPKAMKFIISAATLSYLVMMAITALRMLTTDFKM